MEQVQTQIDGLRRKIEYHSNRYYNMDDPEITDLRNSNSIPMIMKEHSAVTCVSETWDGENNWQNIAG